jgi:hypothetical protein
MDVALRFLRVEFGDRALVVFLFALPVFVLVARRFAGRPGPRILGAWLAAAICVIAVYLVLVIWYAQSSLYFDHAEPTITAVSWLLHLGRPVYHDLDSAERYSLIYGPAVFLIHAVWLGIIGPGIVASKSVAAGAAIAAVLLVFIAYRRTAGWRVAVLLTATCLLVYLGFRNATFWTRPEPFLLLAVAMGLWAATGNLSALGTLVVAVAIGLALDLKFTGVLYLLAPLAVQGSRHGWPRAWIAVGGGLALAALPFLLLPQISLGNYVLWIRMSGQNGLLVGILEQNLEFGFLLVLPLLPLLIGMTGDDKEARALVGALAIAVPIVALLASKPGAGPVHLVPFLPSVLYGTAHWRQRGHTPFRFPRGSVAAYVLALSGVAAIQQGYFVESMRRVDARAVAEDVDAFRRLHSGSMAIGYTGEVPGGAALSAYRPMLVFSSGDYWLDASALREQQLSRLPMPTRTIAAIDSCRTRYWLIPAGGEPFDTRNMYPGTESKPLFPDAFRRAFSSAYAPNGRTRFYEVWRCRS